MSTQYQYGIRLAVEGEGEVVAATNRASKGFDDMGDRVGAVGRISDNLFGKLSILGTAYAAATVIREFVQTADAMNAVDGRLRNATASTADYTAAKGELYRISQLNNASLQDTTTLFTRIIDPVTKMGGGVMHATTMVEALTTGLRVNNATQAESSSAILQFSQAMAGGVLRGEEYNAVNEAAPKFLDALAVALGVTRGKLREMAEEGELTADVVGNAMPRALVILQAQAAGLPETLGTAMSDVKNEASLLAQQIDKTSGATTGLIEVTNVGALFLARIGRVLDETKDSTYKAGDGFDLVGTAIAGTGIVIETVLVLFATVKSTLLGIGRDIGAVAAQLTLLANIRPEEGIEGLKSFARQWTAIGDAAKADGAAARAELDAYTKGIVGSTAKVLEQRDALKSNTMSSSEHVSEMVKLKRQNDDVGGGLSLLTAAHKEDEKAKKAAEAAAKALAKEHENLLGSYVKSMDAARLKTVATMAEADESRKLTETETTWLKIVADLNAGKVKLAELIKNGTIARLASNLALDEENRLLQAERKWLAESTEETIKSVAAIVQRAAALETSNRKAAEDGELTRAGRDYQTSMTTARIADRAATLDQRAATLQAELGSNAMTEALRRESAALWQSIQYKDDSAHTEFGDKIRAETAAINSKVVSERDSLVAEQASLASMGLTSRELAELTRRKYEDLAVQKERRANIMDEIDLDAAAEYRRQAAELRKLGDMKADGIHVKAARESQDAWKATTDSIYNGLTDSLFRAFESGKGFWKTLWEGIVNTFKTTVLKPIIQDITRPFAEAWKGVADWINGTVLKPTVNAVLQWAGLPGMATGGGGGVGGLGSYASGANNLYGLATGSAGIYGSGAAYGAALGTTNFAAGSQAAMLAAQTGEFGFAGLSATYGAASGAGGGAAAGAGAASSLWGLGPLALGAFGLWKASQDEWGPRINARYTVDANGVQESGNQYTDRGDRDSLLQGGGAAALAAARATNEILAAAQSSARIATLTAGLLTDDSADGNGGVFAGGRLSTGAAFGESGEQFIDPATGKYLPYEISSRGSNSHDMAGAAKGFQLDLLQASIQALQAVEDLPAEIKNYVRAYDAESLNETDASGMLARVTQLAQQTLASANEIERKKYPTSAAANADTFSSYASPGTVGIALPASVSNAMVSIEGMAPLLQKVREQLYASEQEIIRNMLAEGAKYRALLSTEAQATRVQIYNSERQIMAATYEASTNNAVMMMTRITGSVYEANADVANRVRIAIYDSAANDTVTRNEVVGKLVELRAAVDAASLAIRHQLYASEQQLLQPAQSTAEHTRILVTRS